MSKLGDHLVGELTGGRGGELPGDFMDRARQLVRQAGSQRAAAQIAGVDRRTIQRWFQREREGRPVRPRPGTAPKVGTGLRRAQLDPGRPTTRDFKITVHDRGEPRERTLSGSQLRLRAGTMERLADVWTRTGDAEAVAAAFLTGVGDQFYRRWLAPARGDRDHPPEGPAPGAGAGGAFDEGDQEVPLGDVDEEEGEEFSDAYDEFYEDIYEDPAGMVPDDDDYGADP